MNELKCITDCYKGLTKGEMYQILQQEYSEKEIFERHKKRYILKDDFTEIVSVPVFCFDNFGK